MNFSIEKYLVYNLEKTLDNNQLKFVQIATDMFQNAYRGGKDTQDVINNLRQALDFLATQPLEKQIPEIRQLYQEEIQMLQNNIDMYNQCL